MENYTHCENCKTEISSFYTIFCRYCGNKISRGHSKDYAIDLNNKGVEYSSRFNYDLAIENYYKILRITEKKNQRNLNRIHIIRI